MADSETPVHNTPLSDEELDHFRELLLEKRKETVKELDSLQESLDNMLESNDDPASSMTHHQGDVSADVEEQETKYTLIERNKEYIKQIDAALDRIENKTYGVCQATGRPISKKRLEAVPHTRYSMEAKEKGLAEDKR